MSAARDVRPPHRPVCSGQPNPRAARRAPSERMGFAKKFPPGHRDAAPAARGPLPVRSGSLRTTARRPASAPYSGDVGDRHREAHQVRLPRQTVLGEYMAQVPLDRDNAAAHPSRRRRPGSHAAAAATPRARGSPSSSRPRRRRHTEPRAPPAPEAPRPPRGAPLAGARPRPAARPSPTRAATGTPIPIGEPPAAAAWNLQPGRGSRSVVPGPGRAPLSDGRPPYLAPDWRRGSPASVSLTAQAWESETALGKPMRGSSAFLLPLAGSGFTCRHWTQAHSGQGGAGGKC